jgi:hypothetical protein
MDGIQQLNIIKSLSGKEHKYTFEQKCMMDLYYIFESKIIINIIERSKSLAIDFSRDILMIMIGFCLSKIVVVHLGDGGNGSSEYLNTLIHYFMTLKDVFHPENLPEIIISYEGDASDESNIKDILNKYEIFDGKYNTHHIDPNKIQDLISKLKIDELKKVNVAANKPKQDNVLGEVQYEMLGNLNNSYATLEKYMKYLTKERNAINSPYLNSWQSHVTEGKNLDFFIPMSKPEKCLIFNTLESENLCDISFMSIEENKYQILVSYNAMEKMRAGTSLILGNPKAKRMLNKFCAKHGHMFMNISNKTIMKPAKEEGKEEDKKEDNKNSIPPLLLELAIYMSELTVVFPEGQQGKLLKKEIINLKKKMAWPRQKVLTIMEFMENPTEESMKTKVIEDINGKNESNLKDALFYKKDSLTVYTENYLNVHYLFGSQLFVDFQNYYESMNLVQPYPHKIEGSFETFLRKTVAQFLPVSPWKKMVRIYIMKFCRTLICMKKKEMISMDQYLLYSSLIKTVIQLCNKNYNNTIHSQNIII